MNHDNMRLLLLGNIKSGNIFDKMKNKSDICTDFFYEFEYYTANVHLASDNKFHSNSSYEFNFPTGNLFYQIASAIL